MHHIGRQAVEKIGQHKLAQGERPLIAAFGEQRVGRGRRDKGQGERRGGGFAKARQPGQGRAERGKGARPAQGLHQVRGQQTGAERTCEAEQRPRQIVPQRGDPCGEHRLQRGEDHAGRLRSPGRSAASARADRRTAGRNREAFPGARGARRARQLCMKPIPCKLDPVSIRPANSRIRPPGRLSPCGGAAVWRARLPHRMQLRPRRCFIC